MFIKQEFLKSYKNEVTNRYFIQVDLNDINFLQAYFANKFQLEVNQQVKIGLDIINDILDRINRVVDNNELAIELLPTLETLSFGNKEYNKLYFEELEVVKTGLLKIKDDWNEEEYNYFFDSYTKQTFKVAIVETLSRIVEVEAFDEEEARDTVEDDYRLKKIILTADDFEYVEFNNL